MPAPKKVDWVQAQKDYLSDITTTYKMIAEKFGVSERIVEKRASVEGWVESRKNIGREVIIQAKGEIVDRNAETNDRHSRLYRNMQSTAGNLLLIANNTIARKIEEKGVENLTVYEEGIISTSRLKFLFEALKVAIDGERVTVGLPTSVERKEMTGKDGSDLFAKVDTQKLYDLMEATVNALAEGEGEQPHGPSDSSGESSS